MFLLWGRYIRRTVFGNSLVSFWVKNLQWKDTLPLLQMLRKCVQVLTTKRILRLLWNPLRTFRLLTWGGSLRSGQFLMQKWTVLHTEEPEQRQVTMWYLCYSLEPWKSGMLHYQVGMVKVPEIQIGTRALLRVVLLGLLWKKNHPADCLWPRLSSLQITAWVLMVPDAGDAEGMCWWNQWSAVGDGMNHREVSRRKCAGACWPETVFCQTVFSAQRSHCTKD